VVLALLGSHPPAAAAARASTSARRASSACVLQILCPTTTTTTTATLPPPPTTTTTTTTSPPGKRHKSRPPVVYPGADYVGRSGSFRYVVSIVVSKNGHQVRGLFDEFRHGRCTDTGRYAGEANIGGHWRIGRNGAAVVASRPGRAYTFDKRGHRVNGTESQAARFRFSGNRLDGTLVDRFSGHGLRCSSGTIRFRASRVGTSGAPLTDGGAISGKYTGNSPDGRWSFYAYVPLHMVSYVRYHWRLHCPHGKTYTFHTEFVDLPLESFSDDQDNFNGQSSAVQHHSAHGVRYTVQSSISIEGWITLLRRDRGGRTTLGATAMIHAGGTVTGTVDFTGATFYQCSGGYTANGRTRSTLRLAPGQTVPYRN
jgi:hypothetical protein